MPGMDGCEASCQIRSQAWGKNFTMVALTGWGQNKDRERSQRAGFDQHWIKPASAEDLRSLLNH